MGTDCEAIGPDSAEGIKKAGPGHEVIGPDSAEGKSSTEFSVDMTTVVRLREQGKFVGRTGQGEMGCDEGEWQGI